MSSIPITAELIPGIAAVLALLFPGPFRKFQPALEDQLYEPCDAISSSRVDTVCDVVTKDTEVESSLSRLENLENAEPLDAKGSDPAHTSSTSSSFGTTSVGDGEVTPSEASSCSSATDSNTRSLGFPVSTPASSDTVDLPPVVAAFFHIVGFPSPNAGTKKILRRTARLLDQCDYTQEEVCSVFAHASAYFEDTYAQCGHRMNPSEVGHIMVALIYIAHCFVLDEACPLRLWHLHLCQKYCTLPTLDTAVMRLMKMRNHKLRLADDDLEKRYSKFLVAAGLPVEIQLNCEFCWS